MIPNIAATNKSAINLPILIIDGLGGGLNSFYEVAFQTIAKPYQKTKRS